VDIGDHSFRSRHADHHHHSHTFDCNSTASTPQSCFFHGGTKKRSNIKHQDHLDQTNVQILPKLSYPSIPSPKRQYRSSEPATTTSSTHSNIRQPPLVPTKLFPTTLPIPLPSKPRPLRNIRPLQLLHPLLRHPERLRQRRVRSSKSRDRVAETDGFEDGGGDVCC
jgi:hypothetical protein